MNSLEELNNFGNTPLDYIDNRPSTVIFDRTPPLTAIDRQITISSFAVVTQPGINIQEIINYQTANVRYRVKIFTGVVNPLVGSTISWASIPSHINITQSGNEYILSGLRSAGDWEAVKLFTWNLPFDYASYPLWYLDVDVMYYDSELAQEITMNWSIYDDRFYYVAQLEGRALLNNSYSLNFAYEADLTSTANINCVTSNRATYTVALNSTATFNCNIAVNGIILLAYANVSVPRTAVSRPAASNLNANGQINCNIITLITNITSRTYQSNNINVIFNLNTPVINTSNPTTDTVSLTLSSALGYWEISGNENTVSPLNSITLTGTVAQVNSNISKILFFPNPGVSSTGNFTLQLQINAQTVLTRTIGLVGTVATFTPQVIDITTLGLSTWTPAWTHVNYGGKVDALIVSGGGAGGAARIGGFGGGGGGSSITVVNDIAIALGSTYTFYVGAGGNRVQQVQGQLNANGRSSHAFTRPAPSAPTFADPDVGYMGFGGNGGQDGGTTREGSGDGGRSPRNISSTGVISFFIGGLDSGWGTGSGGGGAGAGGTGGNGSRNLSNDTAIGGTGGNGSNGTSLGWRYGGAFFGGGGGGGGYTQIGLGVDGGGNGGRDLGPRLDATDGTPNPQSGFGNYNFGGGGGGSASYYDFTVFPLGKPGAGGQGIIRLVAHA